MMLFWLSKHGGCCTTKTHCFNEFSSLNSSKIARWWRPKIHRWVLMHGEACILKGRDVIKQRARWRIGNGNSINVWSKNWLPSLSYLKIHSPLIDDAQEITMSSFINPFTRQWEVGLLNNSFSPTKVELIKKILLSNHFIEDVLFWPYVQSGVYYVKSGYQFLKGQQSQP